MTEAGPGTINTTDKEGRPFELRPFLPSDRGPLERMYAAFQPRRCAQGLPPEDPELIRRWLDTVLPAGHHVVVLTDGALCGHGMLVPFAPDAAELANFLHQSARDRGIGTALNRFLIGLARHHRIRRVWLSVEPSNRRAIRSYEKVGFRRLPVSEWAPELEMEVHLAEADEPD